MNTPTASSKFNAQRAAARAGLDIATLDFSKDADGRWTWAPRAAAPAEVPAIERVPVLPPDGGAAWRSLYEGPTPPTEPVEDEEPAPAEAIEPAPAAPPAKGPRRGKSFALVSKAASPEGITNAEMKALTGWTKFGGFFDAVKRAGLVLSRVREDGGTRWFARPPEAPAA